jgi:hypothetical protein
VTIFVRALNCNRRSNNPARQFPGAANSSFRLASSCASAEQAEMSADALQRTELASWHQTLLDLAVARREEHVVTDRHHVGLRLDTADRFLAGLDNG